jgi:hypothetical protein
VCVKVRGSSQGSHEAMGRPLAILKSSNASPGVSLTANSTSMRKDSPGFARNA